MFFSISTNNRTTSVLFPSNYLISLANGGPVIRIENRSGFFEKRMRTLLPCLETA